MHSLNCESNETKLMTTDFTVANDSTVGDVSTRVAKKPEFLKPAPPLIFDPSRVPDPKKLEL